MVAVAMPTQHYTNLSRSLFQTLWILTVTTSASTSPFSASLNLSTIPTFLANPINIVNKSEIHPQSPGQTRQTRLGPFERDRDTF